MLVRLEAKPGKEKEVSDFIKGALARQEAFTMKHAPDLLASDPVIEQVDLLAVN